MYNNSNIKQVGFSVKLKYRNKLVRCRFFVVPGDSPVVIGMPVIKLLGIMKITCEVVEDQQTD